MIINCIQNIKISKLTLNHDQDGVPGWVPGTIGGHAAVHPTVLPGQVLQVQDGLIVPHWSVQLVFSKSTLFLLHLLPTFLVQCTLGLGVPLATQDSSASSPSLFSTLVLVAWIVGGMVMLTMYMFCMGAWSVVHSTTQK